LATGLPPLDLLEIDLHLVYQGLEFSHSGLEIRDGKLIVFKDLPIRFQAFPL
jgi:hypothetical protein